MVLIHEIKRWNRGSKNSYAFKTASKGQRITVSKTVATSDQPTWVIDREVDCLDNHEVMPVNLGISQSLSFSLKYINYTTKT